MILQTPQNHSIVPQRQKLKVSIWPLESESKLMGGKKSVNKSHSSESRRAPNSEITFVERGREKKNNSLLVEVSVSCDTYITSGPFPLKKNFTCCKTFKVYIFWLK